MLYRTIPSEELSNELRLAFIQMYNWTRIAILYQSESIFQKVCVCVYVRVCVRVCTPALCTSVMLPCPVERK